MSSAAFAAASRAPSAAPGGETECPFRFDSEMPPGVFCVYVGVLATPEGQVCNRQAAVIWSSHVPDDGAEPADLPVVVGFADAPDLVLHAQADRGGDRARVVQCSVAEGAVVLALAAELTLVQHDRETLFLTTTPGARVDIAGCPLGSFRGAFVGMLVLPGEQAKVDRFP